MLTFVEQEITVKALVKVVLGDVIQELHEGLAPVLQLHPHEGEGGDLQDEAGHHWVGEAGVAREAIRVEEMKRLVEFPFILKMIRNDPILRPEIQK